jgi:hypothetical protein
MEAFARLVTALRRWPGVGGCGRLGAPAASPSSLGRADWPPAPAYARHRPGLLARAEPNSFFVQKLLIHSDHRREKKAEDVLYIHDTLELFGGSLRELRRLWVERIRPIHGTEDSEEGRGDRSGSIRRGALNRLRAGIASMNVSSSGALPTRDELHDRS